MLVRRGVLLLMMAVSVGAYAQRAGSGANPNAPGAGIGSTTGGQLMVRVVWQDDRPVGDVVHIQLMNASGTPVGDTFTDNTGMGVLSGVRPGTYRLRVTGINVVETTSDNISIFRTGMQMEVVRVRPRDSGVEKAPGDGMISAQDFNVPDKARKEMDKGMEFFNRGEMNAAEEWFLKAVVTYPKYARAWNNIGVIHIKANDQAGAIEAWKKAVESNDKFVPPFFNIGRAYLSNKQPTDAETYLRKGLALDPNNVDGLFLLVTATGMQGNWDETVQVARKIHGLDHKRYADVHRFAGAALMQLNQHQAALAEYELYLQEDPQSPHAAQVRNTMTQLQAELH